MIEIHASEQGPQHDPFLGQPLRTALLPVDDAQRVLDTAVEL